ncbi:uncharacterized protein LOC131166342 isoform X2 [Malania oleifera]|uniref:uncharacterized protein LOC131166342 isoform X2 n=1 Tax=Malania oleifera TaxID=397392 RepID=UPI0025ADF9C5|nr:uncharacterized protein LOC131166342 isoform X2 [Malania oleifera]
MAVSSFKSTSKRGNLVVSSTSSFSGKESAPNSPKKVPARRSRSVSASPRHHLDVTSDFLNKRDNPLFWSADSPLEGDIRSETSVRFSKFEEKAAESDRKTSKVASSVDSRRGRSVSRNADAGSKLSGGRKEIGRSLSRVDTGRRSRSALQQPVSRPSCGTPESEVEQECTSSMNYQNRSNGKNADFDKLRSAQPLPSRHVPFETSDGSASCLRTPNWGDGVPTSSLSDAKEKTIKAVFEQMKGDHLVGSDAAAAGIYETVRSEVRRAISDIQNDLESAIQRHNATALATASLTDIPPDLVNPGAIELVLDIRREYAIKLEESQKRAQKLRADLAVEEHRGKELSRILKEILPDPESTTVQKYRPGRKTSIERRKMSKRLTEEAMAYFDECVSISTFDSSDFSAPEDPPINIDTTTTPAAESATFSQGSPSISTPCTPNNCINHKEELGGQGQSIYSHEKSYSTSSSSNNGHPIGLSSLQGSNTQQSQKFQFSFARKPTENVGLQENVRNYVKNFEKDVQKGNIDSETVRSNHYDVDEYASQASTQNLLFDRVFFKNRLESGSMLLCAGVSSQLFLHQ